MAIHLDFPPSVYRDPYAEQQRVEGAIQAESAHRRWVENSLTTLANAMNLHTALHADYESKLLKLVQSISEDVKANRQAADFIPRTVEVVAEMVMDHMAEKDEVIF